MAGPAVASPDRIRGWIILPILAALCFFAPVPAGVVDEFYSRDLYPWLQSWLTALSNLAPFAVIDVIIAVAVFALFGRAFLLYGTLRAHGTLAALGELTRRLLRTVAIVTLAFTWAWGCNYRRLPLENALQGGVGAQPTAADLQAAIAQANTIAAAIRPRMVDTPALTYDDIADQLGDPMRDALMQLNRIELARNGRPKSSIILTPFFSWAGVNGMIDPLVLESIVHPDLLPFEKPFVLAHEWSHLAGQADEAEANAIGWLACMHGPPAFVYSASLYLIEESAGALPPMAQQKSLRALDIGVREDLTAIAQRAEQQEKPAVQHAAFRVYDWYLRANHVEDGTASYSRALTLILARPVKDVLDNYGKK